MGWKRRGDTATLTKNVSSSGSGSSSGALPHSKPPVATNCEVLERPNELASMVVEIYGSF